MSKGEKGSESKDEENLRDEEKKIQAHLKRVHLLAGRLPWIGVAIILFSMGLIILQAYFQYVK